jgi:hypothetical protein
LNGRGFSGYSAESNLLQGIAKIRAKQNSLGSVQDKQKAGSPLWNGLPAFVAALSLFSFYFTGFE